MLLVLLNLYGRANRGIKKLRIIYKEGRKQILKELIEDEQYFEYFKYKCLIQTIEACTFTLTALTVYFTGFLFDIIIALVLLFIGLVIFWAILLFRRSLLEKAYYTKMAISNVSDLIDENTD